MAIREDLSEVVRLGAHAQRQLAEELLHSDLTDPEIMLTAADLVDAFRHDPYLTRNPQD